MTVEGPRDWHASVVGIAPELVADIDRLVEEIAFDVARHPPLQLLFNARRHYEFELSRSSTEETSSSAEVLAHRMLEYIPSMIAATPPHPEPSRQVSEEDWKRLCGNVASLYGSLDQYLALPILTAERSETPATDRSADMLQHRLQTLWLYVRGKRYYAHVPKYLEEVFLPHTDLLGDTFGVDGEQFVGGFKALLNSLTLGLRDAYGDLDELWQEVVVAASLPQPAPTSVLDRLDALSSLKLLRENEDWACRYAKLRGELVGMDLYDVERVTGFPPNLLKELSWSPGEDRDFFSEGARRGWPLRPLPVFKRPFVRIDGRSYCLHAQAVFDHLYRVVQRAVARHGKSAQERWNRGQMEMSERLVLGYFERLLPGAETWSSVYYRAVASNGRLEWCETDGVAAFDDHLFVIECRAGSFTYTDPSADFGSHVRSMLNLVSKPAMQGERFVDYLNGAESVDLFDRNRRRVGTLSKASFRCVTVCAVTLDMFTELAARVRRLEGLGVGLGNATVWSLSIDDLRVFADVFSDPMVFLHFVEERRRSFGSTVLWCDDELEYLGLYLKHGRFVEHFENQVESEDRVVFPDVTAEMDQFFDERLLDAKVPCKLSPIGAFRIREIVEWVSGCARPGRVRVAKFLLDMSGSAQAGLASAIEEELRMQPESQRARPISRHGEHDVTVFCWREPWTRCDWQSAVKHACIVAFTHRDTSRLLLGLTFDDGSRLKDVNCAWVDTSVGSSGFMVEGVVVWLDARHRLVRPDSGYRESLGGDGRRAAA